MPDTPTDKRLSNPELQKMYEETYSYLNWERASAFGAGDTWRENEAKKHMANITALRDEVARLEKENTAMKSANNMFCKHCRGQIYSLICPHCGFNNATVAY